MTQITLDTSKGQLVPLVFGQDAVAASQSGVALPAVGPEEGGTTATYTAPFPGEIVAISLELTAAGSAGNLSLEAAINGTEVDATNVAVTTQTAHYGVFPRRTAPFAAGDALGVELTTDSNWNGTTADLNVVVWALLYLEGV